jgi:hypothetical protein
MAMGLGDLSPALASPIWRATLIVRIKRLDSRRCHFRVTALWITATNFAVLVDPHRTESAAGSLDRRTTEYDADRHGRHNQNEYQQREQKSHFISLSIGRYGATGSIHCVMDLLVRVSSSLPERLNKYTAKSRCSATAKA